VPQREQPAQPGEPARTVQTPPRATPALPPAATPGATPPEATPALPPAASPAAAEAYRQYWSAIYRFIYGRVQNREEAEDLTQEVCARVLRRRGAAPPTLAYLRAAALNLIRDRWRRRWSAGVLSPLEEAWLVADDDADPGGRHLDRLWLRGLLERLPADQRRVLDLRIIQGLSRAETAARIGRSEASVRGLQYRAIQALRALVLEEFPAEAAGNTVDHKEAERT